MIVDGFEEFSGYFWLPNETMAEHGVPGRCGVDEDGNIILRTLGPLPRDDASAGTAPKVPRILGVTESGEPVTLEDCFSSTTRRYPGIDTSEIQISTAFRGVHFEGAETALFDTVEVSVGGLNEWLAVSGAKVRTEGDGAIIEYRRPDNMTWQINEAMTLEVVFSHSYPGPARSGGVSISQRARLRLALATPTDIDVLLTHCIRLKNFLAFASDENCSIEAVTCYSRAQEAKPDDWRPQSLVKVHTSITLKNKHQNTKDIHPRRSFLTFDSMRAVFGIRIANWMQQHEALAPSFNLYFAVKGTPSLFAENQFLMLAQAAESLHRRTSSLSEFPPEEYEEMKARLMTVFFDKTHCEWLKRKLEHGNEASLRTRLKDLFRGIEDLFGGAPNCKLLIQCIVATRNYMTHYDARGLNSATPFNQLHLLQMALEVLLQVRICELLGMSMEEIGQISMRSAKFKMNLDFLSERIPSLGR